MAVVLNPGFQQEGSQKLHLPGAPVQTIQNRILGDEVGWGSGIGI